MALNINGTTGISGVDGSASAPAVTGTDSNTGINFGSDTVNINTGGSTRATIDSSGSLDVPTNFPIKVNGSEKLRITSNGQVGFNCTPDGSDFSTALVQMKFGTNLHFRFSSGHNSLPSIESRQDGGAYNGMRIAADNFRLKCGTSPTDRFIVTNDGTSGHLGNNYNIGFYNDQGASGSYWFMRGSHSAGGSYGGGTDVFFVRTNGNVQNANNSYGSSSDIKLKENIVDASSQWDDIKNLKVRKFNYKAETGYETKTHIGLIAQEAELISAGLVEDVNDTSSDSEGKITETGTVTKHIKYSVLYMKAVKALQEAQTRIETLETKVAALEAG